MSDSIEKALGRYWSELEANDDDAKAARRSANRDLDGASLQAALQRIVDDESETIENLDDELGHEVATLYLEDTQFEFVKQRWTDQNRFIGTRQVRQAALELDQGLTDAVEGTLDAEGTFVQKQPAEPRQHRTPVSSSRRRNRR